MVSEEDMMDTDIMNIDMMDTDWIEEYENEYNSYEMFYPNALSKIKVNILYVNKRNELEKVHEKMIYLSIPNLLKKEEMIRLIKDYDVMDTIKYKLVSLLVYNIDIQHNELKNYLYGAEKYDFITSLRNIEDYELKPSLKYLEKVNNIYIVFSEKAKEKEESVTIKKIHTDIYSSSSSSSISSSISSSSSSRSSSSSSSSRSSGSSSSSSSSSSSQ